MDRPKSPEMGPAEGTPIPPLTHQTEPSDGERGRPQNPTALWGFALTEGGEDDEVQQPCKPCFHHCGRGKERMGEEDARERCPRNVPCLSPSAHSDTDMDGRYSTHSPGFSPPTQWVQHGSGTAQLPFTPWSLRLNSRSHQSPSLPSYACPGDVPVTVIDQLRAHPSHPHLADRVPAGLTRRREMVKAGALANESIALNGEGRSHFSTTAHGTGGPWPWREALMG